MSEWSAAFETTMDSLDVEAIDKGLVYGLLHAFAKAWQHEDDCLIWITLVPGGNIFGSTVLFVNDKVLQELQWDFEEWEDGTAPNGIFTEEEAKIIKLHLDAKSSLPAIAHVRKKTMPQNQDGEGYVFLFHYDIPHQLRLTVAVPEE